MTSKVLTESDVERAPAGGRIYLPPGAIVTPSARDLASARRIEICRLTDEAARRTVAVAADHGGFEMKERLKELLTELGYPSHDFGTDSADPVDYPDFAFKVAEAVSSGRFFRGIIIDGAGIGSCMAANKVPGVRAASCHNVATARSSREHNDANVLTLGAGVISLETMRDVVGAWLTTDVGAERHRRRVEQIMAIERKFLTR